MMNLRTPRFWLLTTAATLLGTYSTAYAQVHSSQYSAHNYGTPTMVAAAPSLPSISADQIARDVTSEFNPRTGQTELIAAPFDPFENDPSLAGSLQLRSADGATSIDGYPLRDGAIVDLDFYYNSPSDDPYGGRNYGDVSFVTGELAAVTLRDTRILECSTRVENVVYDHNSYYSPTSNYGIYRPYRRYAGHSAFGFGFGSNYFGPGFSFYNSNRSNFSRIRGGNRARRLGGRHFADRHDRNRDHDYDRRDRDRDRDSDRRDRDRDRDDDRGEGENRDRAGGTGLTDRQRNNRLRAMQLYGSALPWSGARSRHGASSFHSAVPQTRPVIGVSPAQTRTETQSRTPKSVTPVSRGETKNPERRIRYRQTQSGETGRRSSRDRETRQTQSQPQVQARRDAAARANPVRRAVAASETRTQSSSPKRPTTNSGRAGTIKSRSSSATASRSSSSQSRPNTSRSSTPKSSSSRSSNSRSSSPKSSSRSSSRSSSASKSSSSRNRSRQLNFFPSNNYGTRQVVTSQSVDCAREDKLQVFVPNDRLDAARFDGLTLIALDAQGGETPIYIPPNYIEGFRLASTGRIRPQAYQAQPPVYQSPTYQPPIGQPQPGIQLPPRQIEVAPCPAGTTKQTDGTCLQGGVSGYPR